MEGWIKLHRTILESFAFSNPTTLKLWIWILAKASSKERFVPIKVSESFRDVKLEPGQMLFGRFKAEEELEINGSTIYRHLQKLQDHGNISMDTNTQYTIITICNWDKYQSTEEESEQAANSQRTANELPANKQRTASEHIQESKESKEEEKNNFCDFFEETSIRLLEWCKTEKFFKDRYLDGAIATFNKLQELEYSEDQIKKAIVNGRTGFMAANFQNPEKLIAKNSDKVYYIDVFIELTGKDLSKEEREEKRSFFEKECEFAINHDKIPGKDYKKICIEIFEGGLSFLLSLPNQMNFKEYMVLRKLNDRKGIDDLWGNLDVIKRFPGKAKKHDSVYKLIRETINGNEDDEED